MSRRRLPLASPRDFLSVLLINHREHSSVYIEAGGARSCWRCFFCRPCKSEISLRVSILCHLAFSLYLSLSRPIVSAEVSIVSPRYIQIDRFLSTALLDQNYVARVSLIIFFFHDILITESEIESFCYIQFGSRRSITQIPARKFRASA